jgi:hypothetical protein
MKMRTWGSSDRACHASVAANVLANVLANVHLSVLASQRDSVRDTCSCEMRPRDRLVVPLDLPPAMAHLLPSRSLHGHEPTIGRP